MARSVPLVWGNDNSRDYLPHPKSAIVESDFKSHAELAAYLKRVLSDGDTWMSHQRWREEGLISRSFVRYLYLGMDYLACRICEWSSHKKAPYKRVQTCG